MWFAERNPLPLQPPATFWITVGSKEDFLPGKEANRPRFAVAS